MRLKIAKQLITAVGVAAITLCGPAMIASANPPPDKNQQKNHEQQKPKPAKPQQAKPQQAKQQQAKQQQAKQQQARQQQAKQQARPQQAQARQAQPPAQKPVQNPKAQEHAQRPAEQARRQAPAPAQTRQPSHPQQQAAATSQRAQPARIPAPTAHVSAPASARVDSSVHRARLAPQQQQVLISQQQRRITQYRADLGQARRAASQQSVELQQQHRTAQYRFTQDYVSRLQRQEVALGNYQYYDYDSDPYFYTPADYRYYRGDSYYDTNEYGIALLRNALNTGYREGWLAGSADREDGWRPSYESCYAYRDANYGYNGYYLDRATYNYYFREGFRRGYDDGYKASYRYGRYANGTRSLLGSVVNVVLRIEHLG